jgi:hypothetical protein
MAIRIQLRTWRQRRREIPATPAAKRRQWVGKWIGQPIEQWDEREKPKVLADWTNRWKAGLRRPEQVVRPGTDLGSRAPWLGTVCFAVGFILSPIFSHNCGYVCNFICHIVQLY